MRTLDEIFNEVVDNMISSIDMDVHDDESDISFSYDDNGYVIEGSGVVSGSWYQDGDGYWTPCEYYLKYGSGSLNDLSITCYDEDVEVKVSDEDVQNFLVRLEKELNTYMENYKSN